MTRSNVGNGIMPQSAGLRPTSQWSHGKRLAVFQRCEVMRLARSVGSLPRSETSGVGVKPTCQDGPTDAVNDPSETFASQFHVCFFQAASVLVSPRMMPVQSIRERQ